MASIIGADSQPVTEWTSLIASKKRLDREKGLEVLKTLLTSPDIKQEDKTAIETHLTSLITSMVGPWEDRHGGLMAVGLVLDAGSGSSDFIGQVKSTVPILLEEEESRVRIAAGGWGLTYNHTHYVTITLIVQGSCRCGNFAWR